MPIIDSLMGKKYRLEEVKNQRHELNEELSDVAHERKMEEMAAELEEAQARQMLEEAEHWKRINQILVDEEIN